MLNRLVPANVSVTRKAFVLALWILPLIALANVAILVAALDGKSLSAVVVRPNLLLWGVFLVFVPWITNSLRLGLWGRFLALNLSPAQVLRVVTGAVVVNAVTPLATGGPAIKWALLVAEGVPTDKANTLISFQVAEDSGTLLPLVAIALVSFGMGAGSGLWLKWAANAADPLMVLGVLCVGLAVLSAAAMLGLLGGTARSWVAKTIVKIRHYGAALAADWRMMLAAGKSIALVTILLAAIQWMARFSIATVVIGAAGVAMQPALHWILQWLVQTLSSVMPTPGGAGGAEAAFLVFYAPFLEPDLLVPVMTIWRLLFFYLPLTIAAVLLVLLKAKQGREQKDESQP